MAAAFDIEIVPEVIKGVRKATKINYRVVIKKMVTWTNHEPG